MSSGYSDLCKPNGSISSLGLRGKMLPNDSQRLQKGVRRAEGLLAALSKIQQRKQQQDCEVFLQCFSQNTVLKS